VFVHRGPEERRGREVELGQPKGHCTIYDTLAVALAWQHATLGAVAKPPIAGCDERVPWLEARNRP
jgi:hypothetical protein